MANVIVRLPVSKHVDDIFRIPAFILKHIGVAVCKYLKCDGQCYHYWSCSIPHCGEV